MKKIIISILVSFIFITSCYADNIGTISIPCISVNMPVYSAGDENIENIQAVIDDENSAVIEKWANAYQILDHAFSEDPDGNQWNIQKIFPGAYAWLYTEDATYFLECYETAKTEYDGNEYINGRLITPASSYDILIACCAEDAQHHFVALFRRIEKY